jgi:hypothetical protein
MSLWPRGIYEWGSRPDERAESFPCDRLLAAPEEQLFRAVDVDAPASTVYRWLCQLRAAPYSYDRLDNRGRRSPGALTPGLERLEAGQRVMRIFRLVEFEPERSITVLSEGRIFGRVACTYRAQPTAPARSRLLVKMLIAYPTPGGRLMRLVLPAGDLVMMRRQLLNLKALAEESG